MLDFRVVIAACISGVAILLVGIALLASFRAVYEQPVDIVASGRILERTRTLEAVPTPDMAGLALPAMVAAPPSALSAPEPPAPVEITGTIPAPATIPEPAPPIAATPSAPAESVTVAPAPPPPAPAPLAAIQTDEPKPKPQIAPVKRIPRVVAKKKRLRPGPAAPAAPASDPIAQLFGGIANPKPQPAR